MSVSITWHSWYSEQQQQVQCKKYMLVFNVLPFCDVAGNQYVPRLLTFVSIRGKGDCLRFVPLSCTK